MGAQLRSDVMPLIAADPRFRIAAQGGFSEIYGNSFVGFQRKMFLGPDSRQTDGPSDDGSTAD